MYNLTIANTAIRNDIQGRWCLNDLHKASGDHPHRRPAFFMRRRETEGLINELRNCADTHSLSVNPTATLEGRNGGTFVCKELVYAYAMWVDPGFYLTVIRSFADQQTVPQTKKSIEEFKEVLYEHKRSTPELKDRAIIERTKSILDTAIKSTTNDGLPMQSLLALTKQLGELEEYLRH